MSLPQIENQIRCFDDKQLQWMLIRLCILYQIFFHQNQTLQAIVFELVIFLNYGKILKTLNLFVKRLVIAAKNTKNRSFFSQDKLQIKFFMLKVSKKIKRLITSTLLAWSLLRNSKFASLDSFNQKQDNSVVHERVIKNEFNIHSLEDPNGPIIETGTSAILTQKDHESSLNMDEVFLLKADDSPSITPTGRGQPTNFPVAPPSGGRPVPGVNPYRTAPKLVHQGLGAGANPAGAGGGGENPQLDEQDTCPDPQKQQPQESNTPNHDLTSKSKKKKKKSKLDELAKPDLPLDARQKLLEDPHPLELSIDPRTGMIDKQSFDEAESILQARRETGLFDTERRPDSQKAERDIDFILSSSFYDEADIKTPKSFFDSRKGLKKPIPQDMLDYLAKDSGAKSILQKRGSESCLHILDLKDIQPHQKESYKANYLQGAREADPELAKHIIVQND